MLIQIKSLILLVLLSLPIQLMGADYPAHWWTPVSRDGAPAWEVLPQDAKPGEVVLSKRNELGIFSNFGDAAFDLENVRYASVEGLWQMMKYPDPAWEQDPRHKLPASVWPFTRSQVAAMTGFEAKRAGDEANKIYEKYKLKLISYHGQYFDYKDMAEGSDTHFMIIKEAIHQKVLQNPEVKELLLKTRGLKLIPDHQVGPGKPKSYYYFIILMALRDFHLNS